MHRSAARSGRHRAPETKAGLLAGQRAQWPTCSSVYAPKTCRPSIQVWLIPMSEIFCGEKQILDKTKNVLAFMDDPALSRVVGKLKRARSLASFAALLESLEEKEIRARQRR